MSFPIKGYQEKVTIANEDAFVIASTAEGDATRHVTRDNLLSSAPLPANTVDAQAMQDNAVPAEKLGTPVAFGAYQSASVSVPNAANTKILFQTEENDFGSNYDTSNSRFTAPYNGVYGFFSAIVLGAPGDSTLIEVLLYKNGAVVKKGQLFNNGGINSSRVTIATSLTLAASDYIEVYVFQNSGSTKTTSTGQADTYFNGFLVGRTD